MHHLLICIAVTVASFCAIVCILSRHGYAVQICAVVYIISLTLTQLLMSELSSKPFSYRYPAYVTVLHFLACWFCSVAYWAVQGDLEKCRPRSLGHPRRFLYEIVPITLTLPIAVACNNVALLYIAAGLNSIISALTPITTALLSAVLGRKITRLAWAGLLIALVGAVVISLGEAHAALGKGAPLLQGLVFALAAVVFRSLKTVLQDRVLNAAEYRRGETKELIGRESISPMHLWALQAPPMVLVSLVYALCTESLPSAVRHISLHNIALILVTCVSATALNILGAMTIHALGASLMQVIGKLNIFVTVAFSVAFLGEALPLKVVIGAIIMLLGVVVFEMAEKNAPKRDDSEIIPGKAQDAVCLKAI
mmetsp:Transcript_1637/g.5578  ORF Transcript_1637/g.5578 Transcript_1637/m.5578 type:complete len:367 (-) Transcript_1637:76-1176(-)